MRWEHVGLLCFFASYALAFALGLVRLLTPARTSLNRWGAIVLSIFGLIAHSIYLVVRSRQHGLPPLIGSVHDWLLVLAWCGAGGLIFLELADRQSSVDLFVWPIILLFVAGAAYAPHQPNDRVQELRAWGMWHAAFLVFGIGGIVSGFVTSLMYLIQHRRLKKGTLDDQGLPMLSLERLSRINWWLVVISVPVLSLGMGSGIYLSILSKRTAHPISLRQAEFVIDCALWVVLLLLFVWVLMERRASGKSVAWRTAWSGGFLLATLLLLGVFGRGHGISGRSAAKIPLSPTPETAEQEDVR